MAAETGREGKRRKRKKNEVGAPLKRKPKQLDEDPTVFNAKKTDQGTVLQVRADRRNKPPGDLPPGGTPEDYTDEEGRVVELREITEESRLTYERARAIARKLSLPKPRRSPREARRGPGHLHSQPYRGSSDEIDIDKTLMVLAEKPVPSDEDIIVHEWIKSTRQVVLLVDVSGSMKGERINTAAATVGALAGELKRDQLSVISFWSDAAVLLPLGDPIAPVGLLDDLLRIPAKGLTNIGFPLELARKELARVPGTNSRVILLSDCVHNAGPDPRPLAAKLPRLDVLLDMTGEIDEDLARDLVRLGKGQLHRIVDYRGVAPALSALFNS